MSATRRIGATILMLTLVVASIGLPTAAVTAQGTPVGAPTAPRLFVFSNSSPHISVIDPETKQVVNAVDIPEFSGWGWNDDNNYLDGDELWLSLRDPDTNEAEVITLDLAALEVTHRLPVGAETITLYMGKATKDGLLLVSKMGAGQVVAIDTTTYTVLDTWDVPVNGDVACDADISTDAQGRERFVYPTREGNTVVTLDPETGEGLKEIDMPSGTVPFMLTTAQDGTIWVQESGTNTHAVLDPELNLIVRFPTGQRPITNTFSPDGRYSYVGHDDDTIVMVVETETYEEVARIEVGTNPQKLAVHPSGQSVYAILTKEAAVAVIDTATWTATERIMLGTNPSGIYMEPAAADKQETQ